MTVCAAIASDRLLTADGIVEHPVIFVEDGRIARIATHDEADAPAETLQLKGMTIAPGFLDIHVHGAGGRDVMEGSAEAIGATVRMLAKHGTTQFLATTVTAPVDATLRALEGIADAIEDAPATEGARPIGIHLEGPFLSHAKRGVHAPGELQPPSIALFERFREAARGHIRLMTVAPELPGAVELMEHAASLGIRVSVGHSNALAAETRAGIEAARRAGAGAGVANPFASATHTFNAMRALDHREPGVLGVVLDDAEMFAELICDGVHTTPEAVRLWLRCKGLERAILVTDGMAAMGMPDGDYKLGTLDVQVVDGVCMSGGVLAGSVLTMDRAVANLQRFTGRNLADAVLLATRNPARLLGLQDAVEVGAEANFVLFDAEDRFTGTVLRGEMIPTG